MASTGPGYLGKLLSIKVHSAGIESKALSYILQKENWLSENED